MRQHTRIILAEDDADDRQLFLEALFEVQPTITVATVENGEKLMTHLHENDLPPDCIFLDLNMPRKNGKECLLEIRKNPKTERIPVIIYSTSLNSRDVDETYRFGATCFVRKPYSFGELKDILTDNLTLMLVRPDHPRVRGNFVINPGNAYGKS
jgi:CheY-like chemotaxis protein